MWPWERERPLPGGEPLAGGGWGQLSGLQRPPPWEAERCAIDTGVRSVCGVTDPHPGPLSVGADEEAGPGPSPLAGLWSGRGCVKRSGPGVPESGRLSTPLAKVHGRCT